MSPFEYEIVRNGVTYRGYAWLSRRTRPPTFHGPREVLPPGIEVKECVWEHDRQAPSVPRPEAEEG